MTEEIRMIDKENNWENIARTLDKKWKESIKREKEKQEHINFLSIKLGNTLYRIEKLLKIITSEEGDEDD